jgi:hypothetical protein
MMSAMAYCAQVQSRALCDGVLLPLLQSASSRSLNASQTDAICRLIKDSCTAEISSDLPRRFLGALLEAPLTLAATATSTFDLWKVAAWSMNEVPRPILWDDKLLQIISAVVSSSGHAASTGSATSASNTSQCLFTASNMSLMIDRLEACVDGISKFVSSYVNLLSSRLTFFQHCRHLLAWRRLCSLLYHLMHHTLP